MSKKQVKKDKKEKKKNKMSKKFDKYDYYLRSVQSPEADVQFLRDTFKELKGKKAESLTEDFCGTFSICCEWVKLDPNHKSIGVELDDEPIAWGEVNHLSKLSDEQKTRVEILHKNVLSAGLPKTDIVSAMNFSYYIFKDRKTILEYFKNAYKRTKPGGLFIIDSFGGPDCMHPNEEVTEHKDFKYYWDQDLYDPVTNHAMFYIHFKLKGEKKREKVFSYDWRMWSLPELKDILAEAGFKKTHVYWEGEDENGEGNGEFSRITEGEDVDAWVAYLASEK